MKNKYVISNIENTFIGNGRTYIRPLSLKEAKAETSQLKNIIIYKLVKKKR